MADDPFDSLFDGQDPVGADTGPKRAGLVIGRTLSPADFAARFEGMNPPALKEQKPVTFEIVNPDGSVTVLGEDDPLPETKS